MKMYKAKVGFLSLSIALMLGGCATVGNEDVSKDNYPDFDLGPSPLQTNNNGAKLSTSDLSKKESEETKSFESNELSALPSLSAASLSTLNQTPSFADDDKKFSVSVDEMSVSDFIHHVYGELLDLDYAISPDVEGERAKVVLRLQKPVNSTELYQVAGNLLENNQVSVSSKSNILYFQKQRRGDKVDKAVGIGNHADDIPTASGSIIQLVPYIYDSGTNIQRVVSKLSNVSISNLFFHVRNLNSPPMH